MPELGPYGSVRGARGNSRPYRESRRGPVKPTRMTQGRHAAFNHRPNSAPFTIATRVVRSACDGASWEDKHRQLFGRKLQTIRHPRSLRIRLQRDF